MKPYESWVNELGFRVIRLHYHAHPEKNPHHPDPEVRERAQKWYEKARRTYPDPNAWAQEMEISWWVSAGTRVYPEFTEALHCLTLDGYRTNKTIYRAWDFGWHAPACLIAQIDSKDRLVCMKEVVGKQQTTREFAQDVVEKCSKWFPNHAAGFTDYCDPAGQQVNSKASEKSEARDVEILNKLGVFPTWEYGWSRKDGRSLVHQLLVLRTDGTPSMYVDGGGCPVLVQGFLGKYVYPPKHGGTVHDEPDENNHPWADIHASLRYLCTGLYSALGLRRFHYQPVIPKKVDYHGYGTRMKK